MNEIIQTAFNGFKVNNVEIPVKYLYYKGHGEPYVTYTATYNNLQRYRLPWTQPFLE